MQLKEGLDVSNACIGKTSSSSMMRLSVKRSPNQNPDWKRGESTRFYGVVLYICYVYALGDFP